MEKVKIISNCPACGSKLDRVEDQLFCRNQECDATNFKRISHFAKNMKIKGLGEKTIEKLELSSINDIYDLSEEMVISTIGEALGKKLISEIEKSKHTTLDVFLSSFSIRLIGGSAARKLASKVSSIEDISFDICEELKLGEVATLSLMDWLENEYPKYKSLPIKIDSKVVSKLSTNIKVCITGKLNDFKSRSLAENHLNSLGVTVVSGVSKTLDYLINEDNKPSSKLSKAQEYGIPVVSIKQIEEKINE